MTRRSDLLENLAAVEARIENALAIADRSRDEITLIAVTKFFPASDVEILYESGLRHFGENRDDEGAAKSALLPGDAHWHFQGQIQSRKIPSILRWSRTIHSLDSLDHAAKCSRILAESGDSREFFLQVNLEPDRADRGGIALDEIDSFHRGVHELPGMNVIGLMSVLPLTANPESAFNEIARRSREMGLPSLSLGMSGDFEAAIVAGATHIRVGSSILGSRPGHA